MPARRPKIGTAPRRQADSEPGKRDDAVDAQERALKEDTENQISGTEGHDRRWQPGARGKRGPHPDEKPGTRRDIEESGMNKNLED
jgi:hypothetical protein